MSEAINPLDKITEQSFWEWFNKHAAPNLGFRERTLRKTFEYLDTLPDPIVMVETGCLRKIGQWSDGQSTLLFCVYKLFRGNGARVITVDIDPISTQNCFEIVGNQAEINTYDSVAFLHKLKIDFTAKKIKPSFFYLDSFDVNWYYPLESAAHHLKELTAISPILEKNTLVVIDDSPVNLHGASQEEGKFGLILNLGIGGKGMLVAQYAYAVGATILFSEYQAGFIGF
jgi:hypothetical protein